MDSAVVSGSFADFKNIKGRSVVQLIIEIPVEKGPEMLKALGYPQPGSEIPVAVARLVETPRSPSPSSDKGVAETPEEPHRPPPGRKWEELPYWQRAAIRCTQEDFRKYAAERLNADGIDNAWIASEKNAAEYIRRYCMVKSRADIDSSAQSINLFQSLERSYDTWLKYERGR